MEFIADQFSNYYLEKESSIKIPLTEKMMAGKSVIGVIEFSNFAKIAISDQKTNS